MSLKKLTLCGLLALTFIAPARAGRPKLVVAILVDQLRYDYLERFHDEFPEGGFRLLTDHGVFMTFARYNYVPTITGPGHASFFSGSPPAMHGIIGNDWYDKRTRKSVYCCGDSTVSGVGTKADAGKMSPRNFIGANFADQMRLTFRSKVVGISMKDRGAILPAGRKPTGAFWFEAASGNFVTSTYYMAALPGWVTAFNDRKRPAEFFGQTWDRLLKPEAYEREDNLPGEGTLPGEKVPTFPHTVVRPTKPATPKPPVADDAPPVVEPAPATPNSTTNTTPAPAAPIATALAAAPRLLASVAASAVAAVPVEKAAPATPAPATPAPATPAPEWKESYDNILPTPFSNQLLAEFARAAVEGEHLGEGAGPDVLTVSFSAVDACGHRFGPYSQEVQDITLRMDRELAGLFAYLDKKIGLANVVITLTADHGVMPTPEFATKEGFDGQRADEVALMGDLQPKLSQRFGNANVLLARKIFDGQIYFNHDALRDLHIDAEDVASFIRDWALGTGKFQAAYSRRQILDGRATGLIGERVTNGFNAERSGDVVLIYKPFEITWPGKTGTTHGSAYSYDTHVPILFYGTPFKPGRYADEFYITDLVPTLCAALHIDEPPMSIGKPFVKALAEP